MERAIRECLDTGKDLLELAKETGELSPSTPDDSFLLTISLSVGETLLQLLGALPDPLIPFDMHTRCESITDREEAFELLSDLPPASANIWISMTSLLHFVARQQARGPEAVQRLAGLFAPACIRYEAGSLFTPNRQRKFLAFFIAGL